MKAYHGTSMRFDEFDLRFTCDMGFHFGDKAQARQRLANVTATGDEWIILECEIAMDNPITNMPDVGDWSDHQVVSEAILDTQRDKALQEIARRYLNAPYQFIGKQPHEKMKEEMLAMGYDGIIYNNVAEGNGESYLVFLPAQIIIL